MKIDKLLISKLEHLARLEVAPKEEARLMNDLNNILAMVEKLEELDTDAVEPLAYINEDVNVFREDFIAGQVRHEAALRNAPGHDDTHFKVPKVIDL
ncbi:MAG: Asp-tRNA(Asn)/Glu-tRNA(Gln) amidotransferase subunit GatC [Phaeodactylibacter sp.]|nr:Asp-tRNA(Asn)/Glu-tRNA(Gln) amidotransferase subunit GatC [Phaeodactylibacter sp.]MCB9303370.1 Asp-tRNA(Asn)/Glu-tRNA(Gln) amidotransferase subunit GatC [Lewinellaceae bacterium]HQU61099.1 Asp-tRNA(Asn)/Glu-tRNA(Gln) amidotransferase subunit GatC [Saprospiraceae bacterium]